MHIPESVVSHIGKLDQLVSILEADLIVLEANKATFPEADAALKDKLGIREYALGGLFGGDRFASLAHRDLSVVIYGNEKAIAAGKKAIEMCNNEIYASLSKALETSDVTYRLLIMHQNQAKVLSNYLSVALPLLNGIYSTLEQGKRVGWSAMHEAYSSYQAVRASSESYRKLMVDNGIDNDESVMVLERDLLGVGVPHIDQPGNGAFFDDTSNEHLAKKDLVRPVIFSFTDMNTQVDQFLTQIDTMIRSYIQSAREECLRKE
jgi:hypothetical protein